MPRIRRKFTILICALILIIFLLIHVFINQQIPSTTSAPNSSSRRTGESSARHHPNGLDTADKSQKKSSSLARPRVGRPGTCSLQSDVVPPVDINMLDFYKDLAFDNPDGGVWKQGWDVSYGPSQWTELNKLSVFVVPHSHNDPGWIQTVDEYYERQTKQIFANMLRHLNENDRMTFIWAEICYFSRWYERLSREQQRNLKRLVARKQLEFVTGGWVMPDEANSHWYSLVEQLTEGQTWLRNHLNVTPVSSWSIDPFGHSPSMAYVLKAAGFENMLIQRTHYVVKKAFAKRQNLEFRWQQLWDTDDSTSIFAHMMPFYSYDVPHTCGPDPKVCCQFDFKRLPGYGVTCPWRVPPQAIKQENVASRAQLIVDQWKKKATLYRTNAVLIPLGDDFRYTQSVEWEAQRINFEKIFDYVNNEPTLGVEVKFGTLQEYFDAVHKDTALQDFPSLVGDFFTYADRDDHYWSGYYTTRPYHKRLDRVLMHYIRSAEMLHAWSQWEPEAELDKQLTLARREHSLFQHHDGITGTAKDHVVRDYAERMLAGLKAARHVIQQSVYKLLTRPNVYQPDYQFAYFSLDDARMPDGPGESRATIILGDDIPKKYVVLHNSLPYQRTELVEFHIARPFVIVTDADESITYSQVAPVWTWNAQSGPFSESQPQASGTKFRLLFKATVPPLGLAVYIVHTKSSSDAVSMGTSFARTTIYTRTPFSVRLVDYPYNVEWSDPKPLALHESEGTSASFNENGLLTSLATEGNSLNASIRLEFLKYGTRRPPQPRSGAYLFLPDGPAKHLPLGSPVVLVQRGPLESSVTVGLPFGVHETVVRENTVEIKNFINIGQMDNTEIVMRLSTNIDSGEEFFTDLNGLQLIRRHRFTKIPLQANYYPIPTAIFIEDASTRLTVLSGQPLGGTSLASGEIEIMQDRRLAQDDDRGLGQGVTDNQPVLHLFRLVLESRERCRRLDDAYPAGFLTLQAHLEREALLHGFDKLIYAENEWYGMVPVLGQTRAPLAAGMEVVALKTLSPQQVGVVLHRSQLQRCEGSETGEGRVALRKVLGLDDAQSIYSAPITLLRKQATLTSDVVDFCPMDTKAFIIQR